MKPVIVLAVILIALSAAQLRAEPAPHPFFAHYNVQIDGLKVGELERSLRHYKDDVYILESKMYTTGLVALFKQDLMIERSVWRTGKTGPVPLEYESRHEGRGKDIVERLRFDWKTMRVTSLRDGVETEVPIEKGVLDKLMYQIALRRDLARGLKTIDYEVADRGDIRTYRFRVVGEETVNTPMGPLKTLKVARLSHSKERRTTLWCAVDLDYLMVQLIQEDDGHTYASYITEARP